VIYAIYKSEKNPPRLTARKTNISHIKNHPELRGTKPKISQIKNLQ
jgi:hypothetical protein